MWPFKRRTRSAEVHEEASWAVAQGQYNGSPLFARIRSEPGRAVRSTHGHRVGIAVPLRNPSPDGLPQGDEFADLDAIEDALTAAFEIDAKAVHVLSLTTSGMREFVLYTSDPGWAQAVFESLRAQVHSHELQLAIESDPTWSVYQ